MLLATSVAQMLREAQSVEIIHDNPLSPVNSFTKRSLSLESSTDTAPGFRKRSFSAPALSSGSRWDSDNGALRRTDTAFQHPPLRSAQRSQLSEGGIHPLAYQKRQQSPCTGLSRPVRRSESEKKQIDSVVGLGLDADDNDDDAPVVENIPPASRPPSHKSFNRWRSDSSIESEDRTADTVSLLSLQMAGNAHRADTKNQQQGSHVYSHQQIDIASPRMSSSPLPRLSLRGRSISAPSMENRQQAASPHLSPPKKPVRRHGSDLASAALQQLSGSAISSTTAPTTTDWFNQPLCVEVEAPVGNMPNDVPF